MPDLSRAIFLIGALPFLMLGALHAWHTPERPEDAKGLAPHDPGVGEAMRGTTPRLTTRTDLWRAWVGFNYSHSLGAVLFGLFVVLIGRSAESYALNGGLAAPLALVTALCYLRLSARYWFRTPTIGIAVSVAAFATACALLALTGPVG